MGLYTNAFYFAVTLYAIIEKRELIVYFFTFIGLYAVIHILTPSGKWNGVRKKIMLATWEPASDGNIYEKMEIDCTKLNAYIDKLP